MIYLDTYVVVWLYQKNQSKFSPEVITLIDKEELLISPMVELELEYLFEIERMSERQATGRIRFFCMISDSRIRDRATNTIKSL